MTKIQQRLEDKKTSTHKIVNHSHRDSQADRQRARQPQTETDMMRQIQRRLQNEQSLHTESQTLSHANRQTYRHRRTDRQTDRHSQIQTLSSCWKFMTINTVQYRALKFKQTFRHLPAPYSLNGLA